MAVWVAVAGAAATVLVAVITWLAAKRVTSGRVSTTEATTLWAAAEQIRMELRDEVQSLRARLEALDGVLREAQEELRKAQEEISRLEARLTGQPPESST